MHGTRKGYGSYIYICEFADAKNKLIHGIAWDSIVICLFVVYVFSKKREANIA